MSVPVTGLTNIAAGVFTTPAILLIVPSFLNSKTLQPGGPTVIVFGVVADVNGCPVGSVGAVSSGGPFSQSWTCIWQPQSGCVFQLSEPPCGLSAKIGTTPVGRTTSFGSQPLPFR